MVNEDGVDYKVVEVKAVTRVKKLFAHNITTRQITFLTTYICGEDHTVTDRELELVSDVYTRGYNQAVHDVHNNIVAMPHI